MRPANKKKSGGGVRMVDVGAKPPQRRRARAEGFIRLAPATRALIQTGRLFKGDVFCVAQIAGIQAAKSTGSLIPLCHPLGLDSVDVSVALAGPGARAVCAVSTVARTGVEMEALAGVSAALLTVYDMCKSADKAMVIGPIRLLEKVKEDVLPA